MCKPGIAVSHADDLVLQALQFQGKCFYSIFSGRGRHKSLQT